MEFRSSGPFLSKCPSTRRDDFSFPSPPFVSSPSCPSSAYVSPSPSPAFYSSSSVYHPSPSIGVAIRPAPSLPVWEIECDENFGDIFVEDLGELLEHKTSNDCKTIFKSEDLGLDFWEPTCDVENDIESPASTETKGEDVRLVKCPEYKDISNVSLSYGEPDFLPSVQMHWISPDSPCPLPGLVSPRTPRTVSALVPGLQLTNSVELFPSSPPFCNSSFALDSPLTSELTVSGSSEPQVYELQASDGDSLSTKDTDPASNIDNKLEETGTVVIEVKSDNLNIDDGYVWRKYGEKSIKNQSYRRSYYRCAHSACPVRKKTERISDKRCLMKYSGRHIHHV